ncbi:hypothetical protein BDN71DRAFT_1506310 [Pleurotus eryngii]|uniref:Uncharacterized protein n=1 Tax=Pleurotus eryngii TaxID=5323 RepID=A0A9P6D7M5_PLEER|nr:hypothetical protein BDN71DRAFT_1506310 [Pleurotus eryngii]
MSSVDDYLLNPSQDLHNDTIFTDNAVMNIKCGSSSDLVLEYKLAVAGLDTDIGEDTAKMWDMLVGPALGTVEDSRNYSVSEQTEHEISSSLLTHSTALFLRLDGLTGLESEKRELWEEEFEGTEDVDSSMSAVSVASNAGTNAVDIFATQFTMLFPMELDVAPGSNDAANPHPRTPASTNDMALFKWFQGVLDDSGLTFGLTFEGLNVETTGTATLPSTPTSLMSSGSYELFTSGGPCSSVRKGLTKKTPCSNGCGREVGGQEWHIQQHIQLGKCVTGHSLSCQRSKENRPPVYQREGTLFPSMPIPSSVTLASNWSTTSKRPDVGCNLPVHPAVQYDLDGFRGQGYPGVEVKWAAGNIFSTFLWQMLEREDSGFRLLHVAGSGNTWVFRIRSTRCDLFSNTKGTTCQDCSAIRFQKTFANDEMQAKLTTSETTHLNTAYLTHTQSAAKLNDKQKRIDELKQMLH